MNKHFIFLLSLLTFTAAQAQTPITIAQARAKGVDSVVTVTGIVTSGSEFGSSRYFQDATGGLSIFWNNTAVTSLIPGDSVKITARLGQFNNLLQFVSVSGNTPVVTKLASGRPVPKPIEFSPVTGAFKERYESMLVRVKHVTQISTVSGSTCGSTPSSFAGNTNYCLNGDVNSAIRVNTAATDIVSKAVPGGTIDVIGIMSHFASGTYDTTITTGFQLLPRYYSDFVLDSTPNIISPVKPVNISNTSLTLTFTTLFQGNTIIEWGTTTSLGNKDSVAAMTTSHSLTLNGLSAATVYYVKAASRNSSGVSLSVITTVITKSNSSGDIKIYFNRPVNHAYAMANNPARELPEAIDDTLVAYINRAKISVDATIYNFTKEFSSISRALNNAHNRGVRVRFVYDGDAGNTGVDSLIPAIKTVVRTLQPGIMHNKFVVIDAASTDPNTPLVWTGSTNWTDGQINDDPNSVIIIQDQSLARAYTMEFEEMWGSDTEEPGFLQKFGPNKTDNTPHYFRIGDRDVECYFSPSDNANSKIIEVINSAGHDINVATMLCTRSDLAQAIANRAAVTGFDKNCSAVLLNDTSNGTGPYYTMRNAFATGRVLIYKGSYIMHHKYLIVDALDTLSDPTLLVGCHNWSNAANNNNDENTLIIHDKKIVNQYYQEFVKRIGDENAGVNTCNIFPGTHVGIKEKTSNTSVKIYPNPTDGQFTVELPSAKAITEVTVTDLSGRKLQHQVFSPGQVTMDMNRFPKGVYLLQVKAGQEVYVTKITLN